MVNISRILKILTWHGFDEFGWNDPILIEHQGLKNKIKEQ